MVHAVLIRKTGPPGVLELVDDYEKPTIKDGEVPSAYSYLAQTTFDCLAGLRGPRSVTSVLDPDAWRREVYKILVCRKRFT